MFGCSVSSSLFLELGGGASEPQMEGVLGLANHQSEVSEEARKEPPTADTGPPILPRPALQWSLGDPTQRSRIGLLWHFRLRSLRHMTFVSEACGVRSKEREINSRLCLA